MKTWPLFIFLLMLYSSVFSQQAARWDLAASPQIGKLSVIDKEFSAMPFSAILPGASLSLKYEGQRTTHEVYLSYLGGRLSTDSHPGYHQDQHFLNIDYTGSYRLGPSDAVWTGSIGAAVQTLYDQRTYPELTNRNNTFDFAASLGLAGSLVYSFNNIWSLSGQLTVPFAAWLAEPDDRRHIVSFSSFMRLKNTTSLNGNLSSHTVLSLTYSWNYYRLKDERDVREADHRLEITYHLIF